MKESDVRRAITDALDVSSTTNRLNGSATFTDIIIHIALLCPLCCASNKQHTPRARITVSGQFCLVSLCRLKCHLSSFPATASPPSPLPLSSSLTVYIEETWTFGHTRSKRARLSSLDNNGTSTAVNGMLKQQQTYTYIHMYIHCVDRRGRCKREITL